MLISRWKALGASFLVLMFAFSVARLEHYFWNHQNFAQLTYFQTWLAFIYGLRFDASAVSYTLIPATLFSFLPLSRKELSWLSLLSTCLVATFFLFLTEVDVELINFTGQRMVYSQLFLLFEGVEKGSSFLTTYFRLNLQNFIITSITLFLLARIWLLSCFKAVLKPATWVGAQVVILLLLVIAARGGLQNKPINVVHSRIFENPQTNNLILNSAFTVLMSAQQKSLELVEVMSEEKMLEILQGPQKPQAEATHFLWPLPDPAPKNVVLIILESFSAEYTGLKSRSSQTPFLDSLMDRSINYTHFYANARRSAEGISALLAEVPAWMDEPFVSSPYTNIETQSWFSVLKAANYQTAFFHGGHNGTMFFDAFTKSLGVTQYFGASEYNNPKHDDGVWGIWDHHFFPYVIHQISNFDQPFAVTLFTLSSHHPFAVPQEVEAQFPAQAEPILRTIRYTDWALGQFFKEAEKTTWYSDTLFIVTADHTGPSLSPNPSPEDLYHIPFLIFYPQAEKALAIPQFGQHIDLGATILDVLGLSKAKTNFLVKSLRKDQDSAVLNYSSGNYFHFGPRYELQSDELISAQKQYFSKGLLQNQLLKKSNN